MSDGKKKWENEFENFARPFTPQNQLQSPRNFAKMCFRQFPTFRFSTSKILFSKMFAKKQQGFFKSQVAQQRRKMTVWITNDDTPTESLVSKVLNFVTPRKRLQNRILWQILKEIYFFRKVSSDNI